MVTKALTPAVTPTLTPVLTFTDVLQRLAERKDLSQDQAAAALDEMVDGDVSDAQAAAFLMGLRAKGETADEIAGLAEALRRRAIRVTVSRSDELIDIVGTGGDGRGTFNISTAAAFVVAGAGVKVAKHGNRAASSRCGSADVLEALGVRLDLSPVEIASCVEEVGIGFMLASLHHPASGRVAGVRKALGVRTVFNFLGPLTNPAGVRRLLLGVSAPEYMEVLAGALARMGCERALLVHGEEGIDELSVTGPSTVLEVNEGAVAQARIVCPEEHGIPRQGSAALAGGDPRENAAIIRNVLGGKRGGPRDVVLLNAGAALYVAGVVSSIDVGVSRARASIDSGRASRVLEDMVLFTNRTAGVSG
jgi:anthranilate phosphoribosyltransferase